MPSVGVVMLVRAKAPDRIRQRNQTRGFQSKPERSDDSRWGLSSVYSSFSLSKRDS